MVVAQKTAPDVSLSPFSIQLVDNSVIFIALSVQTVILCFNLMQDVSCVSISILYVSRKKQGVSHSAEWWRDSSWLTVWSCWLTATLSWRNETPESSFMLLVTPVRLPPGQINLGAQIVGTHWDVQDVPVGQWWATTWERKTPPLSCILTASGQRFLPVVRSNIPSCALVAPSFWVSSCIDPHYYIVRCCLLLPGPHFLRKRHFSSRGTLWFKGQVSEITWSKLGFVLQLWGHTSLHQILWCYRADTASCWTLRPEMLTSCGTYSVLSTVFRHTAGWEKHTLLKLSNVILARMFASGLVCIKNSLVLTTVKQKWIFCAALD